MSRTEGYQGGVTGIQLGDVQAFHAPLWRDLADSGDQHLPIFQRLVGFRESLASLVEQGYGVSDIGPMFGVSRERARQWLRKLGIAHFPVRTPPRVWDWKAGRFMALPVKRNVHFRAMRRASAERRRQGKLDTIQERFWRNVNATDGCWEWMGKVVQAGRGDSGRRGAFLLPYGIGGKRGTSFAHRVAFLFAYGELPTGRTKGCLIVCHSCDNPICVNPDHLYLATHKENIGRSVSTGRWAASHGYRGECRRGHGKENWTYPAWRHGKGYCVACHRERERRYYLKRKAAV